MIQCRNNTISKIPNWGMRGIAAFALVASSEPYDLESQWQVTALQDFAIVDTKTGEQLSI